MHEHIFYLCVHAQPDSDNFAFKLHPYAQCNRWLPVPTHL